MSLSCLLKIQQTAFLAIIIIAVSVSTASAQVALPGGSPKARLDDPVKVDPSTEKVIRSALSYLASKQAPNGAWLGESGEEVRYPIAITAYSLMAFQAAGHLPGEGEFGKNVTLAVRYLLSEIDDQGLIGDENSGQYMYFHGIASIALGATLPGAPGAKGHPPSPPHAVSNRRTPNSTARFAQAMADWCVSCRCSTS